MRIKSFVYKIVPKLLALILLVTFPLLVSLQLIKGADASTTMTYQGRLVDGSGQLRTGTFCFHFSLYSSLTGGDSVWSEEWCTGTETVVISSSNPGVFTLELGRHNALPSLDLSGNYYLQVKVKKIGETYETLSPRRKLTGAIFASDSTKLGGQPASYYLNEASSAEVAGAWTFDGSVTINDSFDITGATVVGLSAFETDPEVGTNTLNYTSVWDGDELVSGSIYDDGSNLGIGSIDATHTFHIVAGTDEVGLYSTSNNIGVQGQGAGYGVVGVADTSGVGVSGYSPAGIGLRAESETGTGLYVDLTGSGTSIASFADNGSEVVTIDDGGNVGIGATVPSAALTISGNNRDVHLYSYSSDGSSYKADYDLFRARGTVGSPTTVIDNTQLGSLRFNAYDGDEFLDSAQILAVVDGTPSNNVVPTGLAFKTTATNNPETRMYIGPGGQVGIGTTTPKSELQVEGYIQMDTVTVDPPSADCDSDEEAGRIVLRTDLNKIFICVGESRGWDYAVLTD